MDKQKLSEELAEYLKQAERKAKIVKLEERVGGDEMFVQIKEETFLNPKYISVIEYFQIFKLESFVKIYNELTNENLDCLLQQKFEEFAFLRKLNNSVDDLLDMLKIHGAKSVAIMYVNELLYPKEEKSL
ncbi:MAG: hypothetical protein IJ415_03055 [Clostridia bacterium]|nr:hypothetical protein [Clostridia bacterium]